MAMLTNRVKVASTTTGTGAFTLGSAYTGYNSFPSGSCFYVIDDLAGNWEMGFGSVSGSTLTRGVLESSNSNNLVNFTNPTIVFVDANASYTPTYKITTVSYNANITPVGDYHLNILNIGTQTGNITFAAPSGTVVDGNQLVIRFVINGTGGYTLTWNSAFAFGTDITAAMLPTTANAKFEIKFIYDSTSSKWRAVALVRGF